MALVLPGMARAGRALHRPRHLHGHLRLRMQSGAAPATGQGKVLVLAGPPATRAEFAATLAEALGGEVVCADLWQQYRDMKYGTCKPTAADQARAPHHLLDTRSSADGSSLAELDKEVTATVAAIMSRQRVPVVVGGSLSSLGVLCRKLSESADVLQVMASPRGEVLSDLINRRCEHNVAHGLLEEALSIYARGADPRASELAKGIGYREAVRYIGMHFLDRRRYNGVASSRLALQQMLRSYQSRSCVAARKQLLDCARGTHCRYAPESKETVAALVRHANEPVPWAEVSLSPNRPETVADAVIMARKALVEEPYQLRILDDETIRLKLLSLSELVVEKFGDLKAFMGTLQSVLGDDDRDNKSHRGGRAKKPVRKGFGRQHNRRKQQHGSSRGHR